MKYAICFNLNLVGLAISYMVLEYADFDKDVTAKEYKPRMADFDSQEEAELTANSFVGLILAEPVTEARLAEFIPQAEAPQLPLETMPEEAPGDSIETKADLAPAQSEPITPPASLENAPVDSNSAESPLATDSQTTTADSVPSAEEWTLVKVAGSELPVDASSAPDTTPLVEPGLKTEPANSEASPAESTEQPDVVVSQPSSEEPQLTASTTPDQAPVAAEPQEPTTDSSATATNQG